MYSSIFDTKKKLQLKKKKFELLCMHNQLHGAVRDNFLKFYFMKVSVSMLELYVLCQDTGVYIHVGHQS